jgi:predicted nucleic acid-binding protein
VRIVLDSSVIIDHLRGNAGARAAVSKRIDRGDQLWGIVVTRAEVLAGMRSSERFETLRLLDRIRWLEIDVDLADDAGALARRFRRSHPGLQLADCLIAAGTRKLGASLLTQNVRHFPMFEGLERAYE